MIKDYLNLKNKIILYISAPATDTVVYHKLNRLPEFIIPLVNDNHYGVLTLISKDTDSITVRGTVVGEYKIIIM